jgi:hypothetical protein
MSRGDHTWNMMQTAPNSMRPQSVGVSRIRENNPGLMTVAGGQYSYRPRTPTRPSTSNVESPNLHLRKTNAYAQSPRSYVVMTRRANANVSPRSQQGNTLKQATVQHPQQQQQQQKDPQTTSGSRLSIEHYINVMRDSVHRIGQEAVIIIDQLCFTSRRAQLDALFKLCPSIDFVDAGKVIAYLQTHSSEIDYLRTLSKGHSAIPVDHLREAQGHTRYVDMKKKLRNKPLLPEAISLSKSALVSSNGVNADVSGPNATPMSVRFRQEEAHARTHAPVLQYGKQGRNKIKSDVQTIFEDLDKQNNKVVVVGK